MGKWTTSHRQSLSLYIYEQCLVQLSMRQHTSQSLLLWPGTSESQLHWPHGPCNGLLSANNIKSIQNDLKQNTPALIYFLSLNNYILNWLWKSNSTKDIEHGAFILLGLNHSSPIRVQYYKLSYFICRRESPSKCQNWIISICAGLGSTLCNYWIFNHVFTG